MNNSTNVIHITESLCPVCLKKIPARHVLVNEDIYMQKTCEKHGDFSIIIWRGQSEPYYTSWEKTKWPIHPQKCLTEVEKGCPYDCGLCAEHRQQTCCVLLEVTQRCNLNCHFCFASSGGDVADPSFDQIREWLEILVEAGKPFIHISGGEPTVRNDLPEIIRMIKEKGFPYIQLNTNGLRLAQESEYVKILKQAGLSSVFMQFDGTKDEIHRQLRGRNLLAEKEKAIKNCGDNNLGIVLVPTIVPGVNMDNIGEIIRFGLSKVPYVRGIHFQPVSYFGRYPSPPLDNQRITLPEVIREIENQTGGKFKVEHFAPSGCDHTRCGFHGDFVVMPDGSIQHLTIKTEEGCCCNNKTDSSGVEKNRNFVARRWVRESSQNNQSLKRSEALAKRSLKAMCLSSAHIASLRAIALSDGHMARHIKSFNIAGQVLRIPCQPDGVRMQRKGAETGYFQAMLNKPDYELDELDIFITRLKSHGFTITGMAFQDCWNVDLERLHECSLHVLSPAGKIIPFCAYNITSVEGKSLYRGNINQDERS